jgi:hypothetical protein
MTFKYSTDLTPKRNVNFPDGEYEFRVISGSEKLTKALPQRNMLVLDIEVYHPVDLGKSMIITDNFVEGNDYVQHRMDRLLKSSGREDMFAGENEPYQFEGLTGRCSIKFEEKNGYSNYRIDKYIPKEEVSILKEDTFLDEEIPF